jgi:hypothetical protein
LPVRMHGLRLGKPLQLRETRPRHREKPHKLLQVGVTPTPATSLRSKRSQSEAAATEHAVRRRAYSAASMSYGSAGQFQGSDPAARL